MSAILFVSHFEALSGKIQLGVHQIWIQHTQIM